MARPFLLLPAIVVAILAPACSREPSTATCWRPVTTKGPVAATVGVETITDEELTAHARSQGASGARRYGDDAAMRGLVEDRVRFSLLAQAAAARGLDRHPTVVEAARNAMVRQLLAEEFDPRLRSVAVTDQEIAQHYAEHATDFAQPEKRRVTEIVVAPTDAGREQARGLLAELAQHPGDAYRFRMLAARASTDPAGRTQGGELAFQSRDELVRSHGEPFAAAVFGARAGETLPEPVPSNRGWHVVRVLAVREPSQRSLDEVKSELRDTLTTKQRAAAFDRYVAELKQRHPVTLDDATIAAVRARLGAGAIP